MSYTILIFRALSSKWHIIVLGHKRHKIHHGLSKGRRGEDVTLGIDLCSFCHSASLMKSYINSSLWRPSSPLWASHDRSPRSKWYRRASWIHITEIECIMNVTIWTSCLHMGYSWSFQYLHKSVRCTHLMHGV